MTSTTSTNNGRQEVNTSITQVQQENIAKLKKLETRYTQIFARSNNSIATESQKQTCKEIHQPAKKIAQVLKKSSNKEVKRAAAKAYALAGRALRDIGSHGRAKELFSKALSCDPRSEAEKYRLRLETAETMYAADQATSKQATSKQATSEQANGRKNPSYGRVAYGHYRKVLNLDSRILDRAKKSDFSPVRDWQRPDYLSTNTAKKCFTRIAWLIANRNVSWGNPLPESAKAGLIKAIKEKIQSLNPAQSSSSSSRNSAVIIINNNNNNNNTANSQTSHGEKRSRPQQALPTKQTRFAQPTSSRQRILSLAEQEEINSNSSTTALPSPATLQSEQTRLVQPSSGHHRIVSLAVQEEINNNSSTTALPSPATLQSQQAAPSSAEQYRQSLLSSLEAAHKAAMAIIEDLPQNPELRQHRKLAVTVLPLTIQGNQLTQNQAQVCLLKAAQAAWLPEYGDPDYEVAEALYKKAIAAGSYVAYLHLAEIVQRKETPNLNKAEEYLLKYLASLLGKATQNFTRNDLLQLKQIPEMPNNLVQSFGYVFLKLMSLYHKLQLPEAQQHCLTLDAKLGSIQSLKALWNNCPLIHKAVEQAAKFKRAQFLPASHATNPAIATFAEAQEYWSQRGITAITKQIAKHRLNAIADQAHSHLVCALNKRCDKPHDCLYSAEKLAKQALTNSSLAAYTLARLYHYTGEAAKRKQEVARLTKKARQGNYPNPAANLPHGSENEWLEKIDQMLPRI